MDALNRCRRLRGIDWVMLATVALALFMTLTRGAWLAAAATSDSYFAFVDGLLRSWVGDIVLTLSVLGVWYHYLAGLRHLYYDAGHGMDIPTAEKLGWGLLIGSVVLTVLTIIIV